MKTLLITSQKGGSGKTALARNLGVAASETRRVLLVDLDPQQSLSEWWRSREADQPAMFEQPPNHGQLAQTLAKVSEQFDLAIIDTPPSDHHFLRDVAKIADAALIPCRPSPDDMRAIGPTLDMLEASQTPFAFVLTQTPRAKIVGEAARVLAQHGKLAPVNIGQRVAYAESGATGLGVTEASDAKAKAEIAALLQYVFTLLRLGVKTS